MTPASRPSTRDVQHRLACARASGRTLGFGVDTSTRALRIITLGCRRDVAVADPCRAPLAGESTRSARAAASVSPRSLAARDDCGRERMLAALLQRRRRARSTSASVTPMRRDARRRCGLPSVSVPVLSTTSVSTFSSRSSASALLDQHACGRAAAGADHDRHRRREAERAGARDDQHGDALTSACASARLRAPQRPAANAATRDRDDARHEPRRDAVGEALHRARACAAPRRPSARSARAACRGRRARRASRSVPVPLTVPPVTRSPGSLSTGIGSPVTIDSSIVVRALDDDAVDRDLFAGTHAQSVADVDVGDRDVVLAIRPSHPPRGRRRQAEQALQARGRPAARADSRAPARAARAR